MTARDDAIRVIDMYAEDVALTRIKGVSEELEILQAVASEQEARILDLRAALAVARAELDQLRPRTLLLGAAAANPPDYTTKAWDTLVGPWGLHIRRSFDSGLPATFARSAAKDDPARGLLTLTSFQIPRSNYAGAIAGKYDAQITAWARSVPTIPADRAACRHEPENKLPAAQYVDLQTRLYKLIKDANPSILWGQIYMAYWWDKTRLATIGGASAWLVPDEFTDWRGVDAYAIDQPMPLSKQADFQNWYRAMPTSRPLIIAEYGQYGAPIGGPLDPVKVATRPAVLRADYQWVKAQGRFDAWLPFQAVGKYDWRWTDLASREVFATLATVERGPR